MFARNNKSKCKVQPPATRCAIRHCSNVETLCLAHPNQPPPWTNVGDGVKALQQKSNKATNTPQFQPKDGRT